MVCLSKSQDFELLQWYPRKFQHPWYQRQELLVEIMPPIFQVLCLVLLPMPAKTGLDLPSKKILTGMLQVLALPSSKLALAKIYTSRRELLAQDWQQVFVEILPWQPKMILQLEQTAPTVPVVNVVQTYHPTYLASHQQAKFAAYQDLLALKDKLAAL